MEDPACVGAREVPRFGGWVENLREGGGVDGEIVDAFVTCWDCGGGVVGGCGDHGEDGGLVGEG